MLRDGRAMTVTLKEVNRKKIFQEIVKQIHQLIKNGSLKAGDRLPPERELAELFKVSRASVREAIRYLESSGLVRARVGDGTYIETDSLENIVEPLATVITGERENLAELFAIRKMIEPQLAALAARNITSNQIVELTMILARQESHIGDAKRFTEMDYLFHLNIAIFAGSKVYLKLYKTLSSMINQTRRLFLQEGDRPLRSLLGHKSLLKALEARDEKLSRKLMVEHLKTIEKEAMAHHGSP
jgi:GntR family transcriptional repressor for pyruvate dehydrogenase complex